MKKFLSRSFLLGLLAGIVIAIAGIFVFFRFFSPSQEFPPTNDARESCLADCTDDFLDCDLQCPREIRSEWDVCHKQCMSKGKECKSKCPK